MKKRKQTTARVKSTLSRKKRHAARRTESHQEPRLEVEGHHGTETDANSRPGASQFVRPFETDVVFDESKLPLAADDDPTTIKIEGVTSSLDKMTSVGEDFYDKLLQAFNELNEQPTSMIHWDKASGPDWSVFKLGDVMYSTRPIPPTRWMRIKRWWKNLILRGGNCRREAGGRRGGG